MASSKYDLVFLYSNSRLHPYLLNIARHMGRSHAVCFLTNDPIKEASFAQKLKHTDELFLSACTGHGVEVRSLSEVDAIETSLFLVPYGAPISEDVCQTLRATVAADQVIGIQCIYKPLTGIVESTAHLNVQRVMVFDENIYKSQLAHMEAAPQYSDIPTTLVAYPYVQHPAWEADAMPHMDYMLAMPPEMLLKDPKVRMQCMESIWNTLVSLEGATILSKLHNVLDHGHLKVGSISLDSIFLAKLLGNIPHGRFQFLASTSYMLNALGLTTRLSDVVPFANFNFELFLPWIRKGVICGISTVMWFTQSARLEVLNCDHQPFGPEFSNYYIYKNFYVPPHAKTPTAQETPPSLPSMHEHADLITTLRSFV